MKRLHVHVGVENLSDSVKFYNALFGAEPVKLKPDYAKWMLDDPRVNFAISTRAGKTGVDHMGIQVDNAEELATLRGQMSQANISTHSDGETTCCYARSEKSWVEDPSGIAWEAYHTMEDAQIFPARTQRKRAIAALRSRKRPPMRLAAGRLHDGHDLP
jgi:catechol 2,3-dioxygenase-like lactoylglutathione lyase family enzyme